MDDVQAFVDGLAGHMAEPEHPRVVGPWDHRLMAIISVAILAVLRGVDDRTETQEFGKRRLEWLKPVCRFPTESRRTTRFSASFALLDRKQNSVCFLSDGFCRLWFDLSTDPV